MKGDRYLDFAWDRKDPQWCAANGFAGVIGYVSHDPSKDLQASEIAGFHAHGLEVALVYETTESRARGGFSAGVSDAKEAHAVARARGYPDDRVVFFADDEDDDWAAVRDYFLGVHDAGLRPITAKGIYGGGENCRMARAAGYVGRTWLSLSTAWTGSADLSGIDLHQTFDAGTYDGDVALVDDFGQWTPTTKGAELSPDEKKWLEERIKFYALRAAEVVLLGRSNAGYNVPKDYAPPAGGSPMEVLDRIAARVGA